MPKSSPGHFSGSRDAFYDPDFTAEISSKMHVPERISVVGGAPENRETGVSLNDDKPYMHVPERIIVAGGDKHIAARQPVPEMLFESTVPVEPPKNLVPTPPRILTLNDYSYPGVNCEPKEDQAAPNPTDLNDDIDLNETAVSIYRAPGDEISVLRTHIKLLRKRVSILETENQMRQQREIILYSAGIIYFFFKGLMWLHRHL